MMRQRQRKTVEELYGGKFETTKSQVTAMQSNGGQKTGRTTERDYGYIISSNTLYNGTVAANSTPGGLTATKPFNVGKETSRRKSARPSNKLVNEKHCGKETFVVDDVRESPIQTTKGANLNMYDNKMHGNYKENPADGIASQHQHHHQQHNHHNHRHGGGNDEDKDDDTDEFFELIRRTVESAIGKSISELLNRNFRELSSKVERFSSELKNTNALLNQMENEINNKIVHYGEENSRHFRYLCMKSEYDKMFYQHQTMMATATPRTSATITNETKKPEKRKSAPKLSNSTPKMQRNETDKPTTSAKCPCRSFKCKTPTAEIKESQKTSFEDISQKSSEVGMREVLEHIQKFCTQMQLNDFKCDQSSDSGGVSGQNRSAMHPDELIKINKEIFAEDDEANEDDDDDWEISSDGMTPRNREDKNQKYGGATARGCITQRGNNGAGDG